MNFKFILLSNAFTIIYWSLDELIIISRNLCQYFQTPYTTVSIKFLHLPIQWKATCPVLIKQPTPNHLLLKLPNPSLSTINKSSLRLSFFSNLPSLLSIPTCFPVFFLLSQLKILVKPTLAPEIPQLRKIFLLLSNPKLILILI